MPDFKAGVFWIGLATLRDPAIVLETVAHALGATDALAEDIGKRELLLLLDNFEQVVEAAPQLASLVETCPNLKLLVTSRELLRVRGEVEYPVPPLAAPDAVELFCGRARLEADETIGELCRRLDNLPLAVELAAARARVLSPDQILKRLSSRLDLLRGGRDTDPRQQTLRATIQWSVDLLSTEEMALFAHLAVFAGGCTLEAAEDVTHADLDILHSLVDKSLVRHTDDRFWMLETIREFAADLLEGLPDSEELRDRHALFFTEMVEAADAAAESRDAPTWLERVGKEVDNLRAALTWARDRAKAELIARLAIGCSSLWMRRGSLSEGRGWLEEALGHDPGVSYELEVLRSLAFLCYLAGDYASSRTFSERQLEAARTIDDPRAISGALANLANVAEAEESFDDARRLYEEVIVIAREAKGPRMIGVALLNLGDLEFRVGSYERAAELATEAISFCREAGDSSVIAAALINAASAHFRLGRVDEAFVEAEEAIADASDQVAFGYALELFAGIVATNANGRLAAQLLGAAEAMREESGHSLEPSERTLHSEILALVKSMLGPDLVAAEWAAGKEMTPEHALAAALEMRPSAR